MSWQSDSQYEEVHLIEVTKDDARYTVQRDDGWSFSFSDPGFEIRVGDVARFYGRGIGSTVRGLAINGRIAFYKSEAEQQKFNQKSAEDAQQKKREEFERDRTKMDAQYEALPQVFRARIDRFRAGQPDFRWEYEKYELFTCEEAVKIAKAIKPEDLQAFHKLSWEQQKMLVPTLDEGHSGNTFGMAVRLAYWFLNQPAEVVREHGAMVPLVGCKDYGCTH